MSIINEDGIEVFSNEPRFDDFACMDKNKWRELREILQDARIPKDVKNNLLNKIDKVLK